MRVRVEWSWTAILTLLGAALCFVPLFDVLGYEWCLVMAIAASLAGAHVGAVRVWRQRRERPPSAVTAAEARPGASVIALWWGATARLWAALLVPLAAVLLNALRVRNCDFAAGFAWFAMLPLASAALGAAAGTVAGLVRPWRGRVAPTALAIGVVVASVAWGVYRFYAAPPIFGYDPFVGYFAGTLYDEEVAITSAFGWARLYHAAVAATALAGCALFLDGVRLSLRARAARGRARLLALTVACAAVALGLHAERARLGFQLDAGDIARALGGERRTAHFVLHYSPSGPFAKDLDAYALDDELRWAELTRFFGRAPEAPVHAFLFDTIAQKRALMGAAHTFIAKPWRREIYLQYDAWPQQVTKHELAHVFAGPFGDRVFGIARRGWQFNVGLIEGVAVAASWAGQPLTPHQTVKVLRDAKLVDGATLATVMGPSFFGLNASQAYAIAGSFCRFLADTRGADKLGQIYGTAGAPESWQRIYGVSFDTLRAEWLKVIDAQAVPAAERAVALERLKRPSVFRRVCAHAQALRKQTAREAAQAGDRGRALAEWEAVCAADPGDPQNQAEALDAALVADARPRARALAEALLRRKDINAVLRAKALTALGDLALLDGAVDRARDHYDDAAALPMDEASARLLTVKRLVCGWPAGPSRQALATILVAPPGSRDAAVDLATLQKLADRDPDRGLYHYLLGRQLFARGRFADAAEELAWPAAEKLPDARFDREAARLRAVALYRLGRIGEAHAQFARLATDPDATEGARLEAEDWRARCDFAEAYRP
jgi:tetratricopeptide (TPR) repeat protein